MGFCASFLTLHQIPHLCHCAPTRRLALSARGRHASEQPSAARLLASRRQSVSPRGPLRVCTTLSPPHNPPIVPRLPLAGRAKPRLVLKLSAQLTDEVETSCLYNAPRHHASLPACRRGAYHAPAKLPPCASSPIRTKPPACHTRVPLLPPDRFPRREKTADAFVRGLQTVKKLWFEAGF